MLLFGSIDRLKIPFDLSNSTNNDLDSLTFPLQVKSAMADRAQCFCVTLIEGKS